MTKPETEVLIGMALQTIGIIIAIWRILDRKRQGDLAFRVELAERLATIEAKLSVLYQWWEYKIERRNATDERRYIETKMAQPTEVKEN